MLTHALGLAGDRHVAFPLVLAGNRITEYLPIALSRSGKSGCAQITSFGVAAGRLLFGDGISLIQGREAGMTVDEPSRERGAAKAGRPRSAALASRGQDVDTGDEGSGVGGVESRPLRAIVMIWGAEPPGVRCVEGGSLLRATGRRPQQKT
jgi:hypothetical protein